MSEMPPNTGKGVLEFLEMYYLGKFIEQKANLQRPRNL